MKREVAEFLVEADANYGTGVVLLYENYSGRGMFGKTTTAVKLEGSVARLFIAVARHAVELVEDTESREEKKKIDGILIELESLREDSLGRGIVLY